MKTLRILLLVFFASQFSFAQNVVLTKLEINKGFPVIEQEVYFSMEFAVFADLSNFTFNLDPAKTKFTSIKDDTGYDLLKAQSQYEEKATYPEKIELKYYRGIDNSDRPGFKMDARVHAIPKPGAKLIKLEGVIAMVNKGEGEKSVEVKGVSTSWNSKGVETELGNIKLSESGSASTDEVTFTKYRVVCNQPIASITVKGGDDSAEARDKYHFGIEGNEIVFKNIPETIDLVITVSNTEIIEIPFSMDVSIGF